MLFLIPVVDYRRKNYITKIGKKGYPGYKMARELERNI
jgi:hypothetical protein